MDEYVRSYHMVVLEKLHLIYVYFVPLIIIEI